MLLLEQFEHLTLHPKNTAKLKELVLQLAVQGKLTENWHKQNPAVEPASELLKRIEAEKAQLVKEKKIKKEKPLEPISADEVPYELPEGWVWCRLLNIIEETDAGKSPLCDNRPAEVNEFGFIKTTAIQTLQFLPKENKAILKAEHANLKYEINTGDILITRAGPRNRVGIVCAVTSTRSKLLLSDKTVRIKPIGVKLINPQFLALTLSTGASGDFLESKKSGMADSQVNITQENIKLTPIAFPPLAEQEAIVARVEELMHKIVELEQQTEWRLEQKKNLGAAALQKLTSAADEDLPQHWHFLQQHFQTIFDEPANVKKLRETILQLAVQGKLTTTWRKQNPATEPASELLKQIEAEKAQLVKEKKLKKEKPLEPVSEDEVPYELPEGWVWCRLGDLATSFNNGLYKPSKFYTDKGYISLRMYNIQDGLISFHDLRRVELTSEELATYILEENDILLNRVNSAELIGKAALIPKYNEELVYESMNIRIKLVYKSRLAKYTNLLLKTSFARDYMRANAKHAIGQSSVNQTTVSNLLYPLPPLAEQEAIVAKVDQLMQLCDELEQQLQQSKKEAAALMQAVVQEALQVQVEVI